MKKTRSLLIFSLLVLLIGIFSIKTSYATGLIPYKDESGNAVYYRGTKTPVMIPSEYVQKERELRAAWVSRYVSDIGPINTEYAFKTNFMTVLNQMEEYNLNTIIFHVRTHHDAFYRSNLNKQSNYVGNVNQTFDALKWAINEAHKRGIEFHAWLNPYRVKSDGTHTPASISAEYEQFPNNPVHNPDNLLIGTKGRVILNPGEPEVREFLIDTVMELVENYDVDAIHFDDYFYADGIDDSKTMNKPGYNPKGLGVADWRREQVNIFIRDLSQAIRTYNIENDRYVQLGISPTGIYRNGGSGFAYGGQDRYDENGNFITSGSNTNGQEHYESYLYADTKHWIDNEWIDYIMPQVYWSFERSVAPYADIVDWWAKVVKYKNVNFYVGHGFYMSASSTEQGWSTNPYEAANQIMYNTKHEDVRGSSIYKLSSMFSSPNQRLRTSLNIIKNEMWTKKTLRPVIRTIARDPLGKVPNPKLEIEQNKNVLTWNHLTGARAYVIYRNNGKINFDDPNQIYDIIGVDLDSSPKYEDYDIDADYNYGIRALDGANQLGAETTFGSQNVYYNITTSDNVNNTLLSVLNSRSLFGSLNRVFANTTNPNYRFMFITEDNKVITEEESYSFYTSQNAHYKGYFVNKQKIGVAFVDSNNDLISFQEVGNASEISPPNVEQERQGYRFSHWSYPLDKVTEDKIIRAIYIKDVRENFSVTIFDGKTTKVVNAKYGEKINLTVDSSFTSSFNHWKINGKLASFNKNLTISVYQDLTIEASSSYIFEQPIAYIFDKGVRIGEGVAFVGGYYLPQGTEFVEAGMLLLESSSTNFDFDTPNVRRVKALKVSNNNEFSIIKRTVPLGGIISARTYLVYLDDGEIKITLSGVSQFINISDDYQTLQEIVSEVPTHITDDYDFPSLPGLVWKYQEDQDETLFDLANGKLLIQRVTTQKRVLEAHYKGFVATIEINFGVLQKDEVGMYYYGNPYSISLNEPIAAVRHLGWSGYTLKRGNDVHFITQAIELNGSGMITDPDILGAETGSSSLGTLYVNVGSNSVSFTLEDLGTRIDDSTTSTITPIIIFGQNGTIKERYNNKTDRSIVITLTPGDALWTGKYLDRSNGITFGREEDFEGISQMFYKKYNVK